MATEKIAAGEEQGPQGEEKQRPLSFLLFDICCLTYEIVLRCHTPAQAGLEVQGIVSVIKPQLGNFPLGWDLSYRISAQGYDLLLGGLAGGKEKLALIRCPIGDETSGNILYIV